MKAVYKNFTLGAIEENVRELIKDCEIWSDLDLSYEEYEILSQKIYDFTNGKANILQLQKSYPLVSVTHAVNFIIYENYDDFWHTYSDKLSIQLNTNQRTILGSNWRLIIEKVGFNKFDNEFKDMSIMPVICQAGIPNNELEDIFDILKYAKSKDNFDHQALLEELTSWRSYAIGLTTNAYIKFYPEKASQFILEMKELVDTEEDNDNIKEQYSERIINTFEEWKLNEKYKGRKRPNNIEVPSPYLLYNKNEKQFSIVLPPYTVKDQYARYMQYKIVDNEHNRYQGEEKIFSDGQGRFTKQQVIDVKPARSYVIHWYYDTDEENLILDKKITGAFGYGSVIFDCDGKKITDIFTEENFHSKDNSNTMSIFENIRYKENFGKENRPIIYWDARNDYPDSVYVLKQLNNLTVSEKIDIKKCRKLKAVSGEKHFVYLKNKLQSGIFHIYGTDKEVTFTNPDVPLNIVEKHTFKYKEDGYKDRVGSLNDILITTLMNYDSLKALQKIKNIIKETGDKRDPYLDDTGCDVLVLLITNFYRRYQEDDEQLWEYNHRNCVETIEDILCLINEHMLNIKHKGKILQKLFKYNLPLKQLEICFNVLKLQTANFEEITDLNEQEIEKLTEVNAIAAMRVQLHNHMEYKQGLNLLKLIGIDAMREMLDFRENTILQGGWEVYYDELFKGNLPKSNYRFMPTDRVLGKHKEFNDMFDWENGQYNSPEIDFTRKHSDGIPFCGQLYLDVLLSWNIRYMARPEEMSECIQDILLMISTIDKVYFGLKPEIKNSIIFYERALRERYIEGKSIFAAFYYCGLVSVILASHIYLPLDMETYEICEKFLNKLYSIFPELVERDLLLADMYVMLNK